MPSHRVTVIVRCEGLQDHCFIYRYLVQKGVPRHSIQIRHSPGGKGAATQWVLQQYAVEVKALRSGPPLAKGLISMVDADNLEVADRKQQHDDRLQASGQNRRADKERIAVVVPKRNIETWIHHLLGTLGVNEIVAYPKFGGEERTCAPAAEEFARRCLNQMRADDLPSLRDGCAELQRIAP